MIAVDNADNGLSISEFAQNNGRIIVILRKIQ